jgi:uncharacterized membrane protein YfcA
MPVTLVLAGGGLFAGTFGALLGLGGGILVVPLLTLGLGLPFREAVAVSLMAVIATSSASAAVYLERRVANLRLGLTLELFTATGALAGGLAAFLLPDRVLAGLFAVMLGYTAWTMIRRAMLQARSAGGQPRTSVSSPAAAPSVPSPAAPAPAAGSDLSASASPTGGARAASAPGPGSYLAALGGPDYRVRRLPAGVALAFLAGIVSALLGVGGGVIKVPAMNLVMGVPLRVATATSNLMIGVTASASAILYLLRGQVDAYVAGPVVVGVFAGAMLTSRVAHLVPVTAVRVLFVVVLCYTAVEMALRALAISIGIPGA